MAKAKKSTRQYDVIDFIIKEAFPPSSPLAIDLLRLMAAYNDITEVIDWMGGHQKVPRKPIAVKKWLIRVGIQHRFLFGLMHETFIILDQLQSHDEFRKAEQLLEADGKEALKHLRQANRGGSQSIRAQLSLCRNKVIFHYDQEDFRKGLTTLLRVSPEAETIESQVILQANNRAYYKLPEDVRDIFIYKFDSVSDGEKVKRALDLLLGQVTRLHKQLVIFLEELFIAYMKLPGFDKSFRHNVIEE